jgi:hypothetical protein
MNRPISLYISWRAINPPVCCRSELKAGLSGVRRLDFVDGPIFCDATPHPPRRPYFASLVTDALWHFDPRHESRDADGYIRYMIRHVPVGRRPDGHPGLTESGL